MIRSIIKRAAGYVWPGKRTPLKRGKPMKRVAIVREPDGFYTLARSPLPRNATPMKRSKPMRQRSERQKAKQIKWNLITALKIENGRGCRRCGVKDSPTCRLEGHHRLPRGRGGKWDWDNHVLICPGCHDWIKLNPLAAATAGLLELRKVAA